MIIDLMYVQHPDGRSMSIALRADEQSEPKFLGPVDGEGAVLKLAPLLSAEVPSRFPTVKDAQTFLMVEHFRKMSGDNYPIACDVSLEFTLKQSANAATIPQ